ncbi:SIS domain-containing protein [Lacticaseibacillus pabuli]|uniref:SIS domain-containing protein n=1 Tax=Lacticaseibacillus pabuli TaxID=3025672 RepID=A0ABY7WTS3_9LACO|nr:SIS domain-containing protein [Lacticaseibacillus sp. KACC 23028]WDF82387.1 SIS domain-containing protein [Lacticaseibacillus sp. KACC 23028]
MNKPTMLTYINEEQATFKKILDNYPAQQDQALANYPESSKHWLILATGSSYNAALSAKYYVEHIAHVRISLAQPFHYQHYEQVDPTIDYVVGVSQSGQSTATVDAMKYVGNHHPVQSLAVTSMPGTEITDAADTTLDIQTGREQVGYVSRGFSATVLSIMLFGLRIAANKNLIDVTAERNEIEEFRTILNETDDVISATTRFAAAHKDDFTDAQQFNTVAYGPAIGSASEMETKFTEIVRVPAAGYELEAYMHGPYLAFKPTSRLFFVRTTAQPEVLAKAAALRKYEQRYSKHVFTLDFTNVREADDDDRVLHLPAVTDDDKAPVIIGTVFQVLAWYVAIDHGINLSDLIFDDFSDAVHNKTQHQNYV